jgi:hypothetical protein
MKDLAKGLKSAILSARSLFQDKPEVHSRKTKTKNNLAIKYAESGKVVKGRTSPYDKNKEVYQDGTVISKDKLGYHKVNKLKGEGVKRGGTLV